MTREIALHCMKSYSEHHSDLCELCPIYGQTGDDHCFEDALEYVIKDLEQEPILNKIRAEIETKYGQCDICEYFEDYDYEENDISEYRPIGNIADVLQIIDKYKAESEEQGMTREQAINSMISHGFTVEQAGEIFKAVTLQEPTTENNLGVEEVTALAEWTEKLTKASEDAYNKGYADGMKEQEPILDKISAEIWELYSYVEFDEDIKTSFNMVRLEEVQRVIDKYKAESE